MDEESALYRLFFSPLAADWRGVALAKFLPEFGWQPIIISAAESVSYDNDYSLLKEIPEKLRFIELDIGNCPESLDLR